MQMLEPSNTRGAETPLKMDLVVDSGRKLLREYSGIPDEDIDSHVEAIVN